MSSKRLLRCGFISLACLFALTGCWDRIEIDDLAMVMGSGLDLAKNGQLQFSVQIASPTGIPSVGSAGSSKPPFHTITQSGKDGLDAINRMQQQLSRSFSLGHRSIIVIGEQYARHGIDQALSQLMRSPDSRYSSYVLTSYGTTAQEILSTPYTLEFIPAIAIKKIQQEEQTFSVRMDEFLDAVATEGKTPITGAIRIVTSSDGTKSLRIDRAAVYRNNKVAAFLNETEMKLLLWANERLKGSTLTAQIMPKTELFKGTVGARVVKSSSSIRTVIANGEPRVSISLRAVVNILSNDTSLDATNADSVKLIESKLQEQEAKALAQMTERSQKDYKTDIFDIGEIVHIEHPRYWKNQKAQWQNIYPTIPFDFKVAVKVERTGRTLAPVQMLE